MDKETFEKGLQIRREVLGAEHVDKVIANATPFNRPMQELLTSYCWGDVWGRPGLGRHTRCIINLAMITALNRPYELKVHINGALNNGVSKDEICEVFLQAAVYCGMPAALDAFKAATEVFAERGI